MKCCLLLCFFISLYFCLFLFFFFFNDTATTEIYTLSLHDALPIYAGASAYVIKSRMNSDLIPAIKAVCSGKRSEEHTSELQSQFHLVCRLLLEKKKKKKYKQTINTKIP